MQGSLRKAILEASSRKANAADAVELTEKPGAVLLKQRQDYLAVGVCAVGVVWGRRAQVAMM